MEYLQVFIHPTHSRVRFVVQNVDRWIILRRKLDKTHYIHCLISGYRAGIFDDASVIHRIICTMLSEFLFAFVFVCVQCNISWCTHTVLYTQVERRFMFQNKIIFTKYLQKV